MTSTSDDTELVEVRIVGFPLAVYQETRLHHEAVVRELTIIARARPEDRSGLPARLLDLSEQVHARYAGFGDEMRAAIDDSIAAGREAVDLVYVLPASVGQVAADLKALLHEADEFCVSGALITVPPSSEASRFRDWFLDEFTAQAKGAAPTPWTGGG